jgi:ABC transporter substrate binding protein
MILGLGSSTMKRRDFITLLGGAAVAWPLAARAQQGERIRRIGVLINLSADDVEGKARVAALLQELGQLGWSHDRNMQVDIRWAPVDTDARTYATELVALAPDVIVASGNVSVAALRQVTRTVPIVFALVIDPVASGFVESLARPGGNATGFSTFEYSLSGKWLELLKEIAPNVTRVAVLRDLVMPQGSGQLGAILGGSVAWSGAEPDQRGRCRHSRAHGRRVRALRERWPDRDAEPVDAEPPRSDCRTGCATSTACDLPAQLLRHEWWPDVLRP